MSHPKQSRDLYRPIIKEGTHLAPSKKTPVLFEELNYPTPTIRLTDRLNGLRLRKTIMITVTLPTTMRMNESQQN